MSPSRAAPRSLGLMHPCCCELIDQRAVPSVGAYLGEVLVRHLGGQWIPRKKLEEAQVIVFTPRRSASADASRRLGFASAPPGNFPHHFSPRCLSRQEGENHIGFLQAWC
ncbi:hypothetical protein DAT35_57035 [Vitiosangium sp. GDMCC 1.1324]|nr:hypothetical protein DAT35_57035 [Vitiosangium sp. GDMCC 1.1324]